LGKKVEKVMPLNKLLYIFAPAKMPKGI